MGVPTKEKIKEYLGDKYKESDDELISLYIETHQFYRKMKNELKNSKLMYEYTNKANATNLVKNPLVIEIAKTVQTLNNLLKSLGLTPAQRKKAVISNVDDEDEDDFDDF